MRNPISILLAFLCVNALIAQVDRDKVLHFVGGNLYGLAGAGIAKQISGGDRYWTFVGAIGGSTLIGLGKEAVDASQNEGGWDNDDLLATILGGTTVGFTIDIFDDRKKKKRLKQKQLMAQKSITQVDSWNYTSIVLLKRLDRLPTLTELSLPQMGVSPQYQVR
ncbi:MAG: hypothetical protein KJO73_12480 [Croceitalea sp.]|nr:hypothetical protein [Croceitalea sp.]MBT8239377.1 hypothetical protein [Croceitalea sp.]